MQLSTSRDEYYVDGLGLIISNASGNEVVERLWIMSIIAGLIPLISLITINLYKHRTAQIRISIFNMLLMLGYYAIYFFFYYYIGMKYNVSPTFAWPVILPLVNIVLTWLSIRSIAKDEALVPSLTRLS